MTTNLFHNVFFQETFLEMFAIFRSLSFFYFNSSGSAGIRSGMEKGGCFPVVIRPGNRRGGEDQRSGSADVDIGRFQRHSRAKLHRTYRKNHLILYRLPRLAAK